MGDLISRQAAIDAVHKNYDTILDFTSDGKTISSSIEDILSELPSAEPESISRWKNEFKEYVDSLDIARDDWKGIIEYIGELPSAQSDVIRCKDCVNYIDNRCVVANHHVAPFSCCQDVFNARRRG